jgi:putative DNA primase/helicase
LSNHLAFWTGRDADRMDRLFRRSGLMRPKWDECHSSDGRTYGRLTIDKAIAGCRATYDANRQGTTRRAGARVLSRGSEKERDGLPGPIGPGEPPGELQAQNPAPLDCWPLTDDGNGRRLVERHGADLRHFAGWKRWAVWDGDNWRMDDTEEVSRRAKDVMRSMYASATDAMRSFNH